MSTKISADLFQKALGVVLFSGFVSSVTIVKTLIPISNSIRKVIEYNVKSFVCGVKHPCDRKWGDQICYEELSNILVCKPNLHSLEIDYYPDDVDREDEFD